MSAVSVIIRRKSILGLRSVGDPVNRRGMRKNSGPKRAKFLSPELLDEAIAEVVQAARAMRAHVALVGGCAMQLYGSDRLTGDVDFISDSLLSALPRGKALSFGGEQTRASNGVEVDLILRDDRWADLYDAALGTARRIPGSRALVVRPEYLLAMKISAGRDKDLLDADFLLGSGEINPKKTLRVAEEFLGSLGAQDVEAMLLERRLIQKAKRSK